MNPIPIIDIFAGPGGLSEGFSYPHSNPRFKVKLSIEKEYFAHQTLELRAFVRAFSGKLPAAYYQYLARDISRDQLFELHPAQAAIARTEAWKAELGHADYPDSEVDGRIEVALGPKCTRWALIGGPPCQAYSLVGRSRMRGSTEEKNTADTARLKKFEADHRHYLYRQYLRILAIHQPAVFVLENVKGLLSAQVKEESIVEKIMSDLAAPGQAVPHAPARGRWGVQYRLFPLAYDSKVGEPSSEPSDFVIRSEDYGVPQARHRVILLGIRSDIETIPGKLTKCAKPCTIKQAISDLPPLRSGLSKEQDGTEEWLQAVRAAARSEWLKETSVDPAVRSAVRVAIKKVREHLTRGSEFVRGKPNPLICADWFLDSQLAGFCNHVTRGHIRGDLHRYFFAAAYGQVNRRSPALENFPVQLLPAHENVADALIEGKFNDRFRVQIARRPSTTVTSHISKDGHYFIHYDASQCRSLTVREAARLQTFPDNYFFEGPRTEQYRQVGNAVPPLLAKQIAEVVAGVFDASRI